MLTYIYVIARDYGFAPNPFYGICTLATCKPGIRKSANIGDWVIGVGSKTILENKLVYLMKISEKISYNEYWGNEKYGMKKPYMKSSLKKMYGDNIYYYDNLAEKWIQADSHHSYANGKTNPDNLRKDTSSNSVLIANEFYYFGGDAIEIPERFRDEIYRSVRGYCKVETSKTITSFIKWIRSSHEIGYYSDPRLFAKFQRYDGRS